MASRARKSAAQALYEESGRVVTNDKAPEFLGAAKGTNNTGELSAVYHALTRANEVLPHGTQTTVLVLADSMLAICTTTGAWAARSNRTLVNKNKRALARLRGKGIDVRFRHIRAHEGHRMNERADALAKQGGQGLRQREGSYYRPQPPTLARLLAAKATAPAPSEFSNQKRCRQPGRREVRGDKEDAPEPGRKLLPLVKTNGTRARNPSAEEWQCV